MSVYDGVPIYQDPQVFSGRPVIDGHRVTVHDVVALHRQGELPEAIAEDFELTPREVRAALSYYQDHREEIDRELVEDKQVVAKRAKGDKSPLAERLRRTREDRDARPSHG